MPHGAEARKRKWKEQQKVRKAAKKAGWSKSSSRENSMLTQTSYAPSSLTISSITEDDLLSFQHTHFGDDSRPECFFVSAEDALGIDAQHLWEDDDGLGYYEDGTKRTLTDEQIAMFRHSEKEQLARDARLREDDEEHEETEESPDEQQEEDGPDGARSPVSEVSSIEGDLVSLTEPTAQPATSSRIAGLTTRKVRSKAPRLTSPLDRQHRREEVPYAERHKRRWEGYIEEKDPGQGSLTHRRLVRELDQQMVQEIDMDYGEVPATSSKREPDHVKHVAPRSRRLVSYAED